MGSSSAKYTSHRVRARLGVGVATFVAVALIAPTAWATGTSTLDVTKSVDTGAAPASASIMESKLTAPVTTATDADVNLRTSWDKTKATLVAGSVVAPANWTVEWYDGTSWSSTEPADPTTVQAVRTNGSVRSRGDGGGGNTLLTDSLTTSSLTGAPASFGASVGGDGYNVAFPDVDRVINVFHHNGPTYGTDVTFDCHLRNTGGACPGGQIVISDYRSPNNAIVAVNATVQHAYTPVYRESDGVLGAVCVDYSLAVPAACAVPFVALSTYSALNNRNNMGGAASDGDRLFVVNGVNHRLYCLDLRTDAICTGFGDHGSGSDGYELPANSPEGPFGSGGWGWSSDLSVIDGKLFYLAGNRPQNSMGCIDPATVAPCNSSTPKVFGNQTPFDFPPIPIYDTSGALTGVCLILNLFCISPDGTSTVTMPTALATFLTPTGTPGSGIDYYGGYAIYLSLLESAVTGQKLFIPVEVDGVGSGAMWPSDLACWDYATAAPCTVTGHNGSILNVTPGLGTLYTANSDPFSDCVWVNSDSGHIVALGANGGPCGGNPATAKFGFDEKVARLGCSASSDLISWKQIALTIPAGASLSDVRFSILDGSDTPLTGWNAITPSSLTIDLTGVLVTDTTTKPTFVVSLENGGLPAVSQITAELQLVAKPPQLCLRLLPTTLCTTGQTSSGRLPIASFTVTGSTTVTANSTPVTESPDKSVSNADFDATTMCGEGTIEGTTTETGTGAPVAGVTVTIKDKTTGAVIATVTTDVNGAYSVGHLVPGDYTVEFGNKGPLTLVGGGPGTDVAVTQGGTGQAHGVYQGPPLPPTGLDGRLWLLGVALLGIGVLAAGESRRRRTPSTR